MVVPSSAQQSSIATKWKERWRCVELWVPNAHTEALWKAVAKGEGRNWGTSTRCHLSKVKFTMWSELNQELQGGIHSSCESNYCHWILSDQQINQIKIFMRGSSMVSDLIWLFFKNICRAMFSTYKETNTRKQFQFLHSKMGTCFPGRGACSFSSHCHPNSDSPFSCGFLVTFCCEHTLIFTPPIHTGQHQHS